MAWPTIDATKPAGSDKKKFGDDEIRAAKQHTIDCMQAISNFSNAGATPALKTAVWTTATRPSGANLVDKVSGYNTDIGSEEYYDLGTTTWIAKVPSEVLTEFVQIGDIIERPVATESTTRKVCNGQAISRSTYATLFALIGTTFGAGDGSTTFNLPNYNNRTSVGAGDTYAAGATGGEATHTLTNDEMPSHNHPITSGQFWYYTGSGGGGVGAASGSTVSSLSVGNTGGGGAHNNMQPYIAMYKLMRVL